MAKLQKKQLKQIPEEEQKTLDGVLSQLWKSKTPEKVEEAKHHVLEIVADYIIKGYNIKHWWEEYKQFLKHSSLIPIILLQLSQPIQIGYICQPFINQKNQLVEIIYRQELIEGKKYIYPIKQKVIKEQAKPEDLRGYKCSDKY